MKNSLPLKTYILIFFTQLASFFAFLHLCSIALHLLNSCWCFVQSLDQIVWKPPREVWALGPETKGHNHDREPQHKRCFIQPFSYMQSNGQSCFKGQDKQIFTIIQLNLGEWVQTPRSTYTQIHWKHFLEIFNNLKKYWAQTDQPRNSENIKKMLGMS